MTKQKDYNNSVKTVTTRRIKKSPSGVIKGNRVRLSNPVRVNSKNESQTRHQEEALDPIVENNEIIGVIYKCRCGHRARILFEYKQ